MREIPFLVSVPDGDSEEDVKGIFSSRGSQDVVAIRNIPTDKLKENLTNVCQSWLTDKTNPTHTGTSVS
jgi:hypothetical protein